MNTTLKPRINPIELVMTRRISRPRDDFSSSTPAPEINETYPGTSGSTHGERNEISPAKNAASGSGRLDMRLYCTCLKLLSVRSDAFVVIKLHAGT
jgi:hypothetical protein